MADQGFATPHIGRPMHRWERWLYAFVRGLSIAIGRALWRLEVHGLEHVPDGPFILSGVHRSNIDSPLVSAVTHRRLRYMGKKEMWRWGPAGRFYTALGGFPVDRGSTDREALRTCIAVIESGEPLVIFPEGQRREGPVITEMFDGPSFVSSRTGAPILPVGIGGTGRAMPIGKLFRRSKVVLVVGPPLAAPAGEDGRRPSRRAIKAKTEELRETLQSLFDDAQRRAGEPARDA